MRTNILSITLKFCSSLFLRGICLACPECFLPICPSWLSVVLRWGTWSASGMEWRHQAAQKMPHGTVPGGSHCLFSYKNKKLSTQLQSIASFPTKACKGHNLGDGSLSYRTCAQSQLYSCTIKICSKQYYIMNIIANNPPQTCGDLQNILFI